MSISGPSALGTLLVQRLDAVLGTTLAQQTNLASGARPDAVSQPGQPLSSDPAQNNTLRDSRSGVDKTLEQTERQLRQTVDKTKLDAQQELLASRNQPATSSTPSAPTTLGTAAKAILALLMSYPDKAPALAGKSPLLGAAPQPGQEQAGAAGRAAQGAAGNPANPAGGANNQASSATAANRAGSAPVSGEAGRASAAGQPAQRSGAADASGMVPAGASASAGGARALFSAAQFTQALTQALQGSGLFYESHLANAAFGRQDMASLHQEPQAHLGQHSTASSPATAPAPTADSGGAASRAPAEAAAQSQNASNNSNTSSAQNAPAQAQAQSSALAGLHPDTHLLVRQQLEVLANQTIAWRGEAWPNAPMQWEIQRDGHTAGQESGDALDQWATRLTLNLPNLGEVQARIHLSGQQLVMQLVAPDSAGMLGESQDALKSQLLASGLLVNSLSIHASAPDGGDAGGEATQQPVGTPS
ncbi:MAG TPA: flagellar hook-length control protein FliK [Eoetvoesiella sp.]|uniref:flagellar hook-length control protein FliK n=1 Tax=Eoetvoesiella sp. TaxID=1966355 RepID=UPI002D14B118|nr:flagellar hook-length control protein FliK [Eoetvoesiella sp.]HWK59895.1 flagellar hook-length control protein FliK [Eoetvoesiella sp.]